VRARAFDLVTALGDENVADLTVVTSGAVGGGQQRLAADRSVVGAVARPSATTHGV